MTGLQPTEAPPASATGVGFGATPEARVVEDELPLTPLSRHPLAIESITAMRRIQSFVCNQEILCTRPNADLAHGDGRGGPDAPKPTCNNTIRIGTVGWKCARGQFRAARLLEIIKAQFWSFAQ